MNIITHDAQAGWELPVTLEGGKVADVLETLEDDTPEKITVPVFSARLVYEGHFRRNTHSVRHLFRDEQTGMVYRFSPKTIEALLFAVLSGEISVDTNARIFEGLFTFQLFSKWVFATPLGKLDKARLGL